MRTKVDWRSASKATYTDFCNKHPNIHLSFDQWKSIIYGFNEGFRDHILETGDKIKFPYGFGEFSINKKKQQSTIIHDGKEYITLPVNWGKTREKGKLMYILNYHTEGFIFRWQWFKRNSTLKLSELWYFKTSRPTARLLSHYLRIDEKYQHLYKQWIIK